jgi:hypothetical protein
MSRIVSAVLLLGSVVVIAAAAEPRSPGSPDSTSPAVVDTTGYAVYHYNDTAGKYKTTYHPESAAPKQQQSDVQPSQQGNGFQSSRNSTSSRESRPLVQSELKSASGIATTGATLFGLGFATDLIGTIIFIKDASEHNYSTTTPMTGYYIALGGGITELIGTIVANSGGSKARNILELTSGNAPSFSGWGYFWTGFACTVTGNVLNMSQAEIPVALPILLMVGSYVSYITSIVQSTSYTKKAYLRSIVLKDLRILPMVDMRSFKPNGIMISGSF